MNTPNLSIATYSQLTDLDCIDLLLTLVFPELHIQHNGYSSQQKFYLFDIFVSLIDSHTEVEELVN